MFRISVFEVAFVCLLFLFILIGPLLYKGFVARLHRRLDGNKKRTDKK